MSSTHAFVHTLTRFMSGSAWLRTFATLAVLVLLIPLSSAAQTINLAVSPNVLLESSPPTEISVSATIQGNAPADDVELAVTTSKLSSVVPVDYTREITITIPAGQTSASTSTTVTPSEDELDTPDNIITYSATHASYTVNPATLTVRDNDDPPILLSAEVDGPVLTLAYDKALSAANTSSPHSCQYTVLIGSAEPAVTINSIDGKNVLLGLTPAVRNGESVTVSYISSTDGTENVDCTGSTQGDVKDTAGNPAESFDTRPVTNTTPIPSLTITGPERVSDTFSVCFTFSEAVAGFEVTEITIGNGSVANLTARADQEACVAATGSGLGKGTLVAVDGQYFTADVTPGESGTVTVDVPAGVATSINSGTPSSAAGRYTASIDKTRPTVTISGPSGTVRSDFTVTFIFSEEIVGFEFDPGLQCEQQGDLCIDGGLMHDFEKVSATRYTGRITPEDGDGDQTTTDLTVTVNEDAVEDLAGNTNKETEREWHVEKAELTVSIIAPSGVQDDGEFDVRFQFSSTVEGDGLTQNNIDITAGGGTVEEITGSGGSWRATITPSAESFSVGLTANGSVSTVKDGSGANYPLPDPVEITAKVGPTVKVVIITVPVTDVEVSGEVEFDFSEEVSGFSRGDIVATNGGTVVSGPTIYATDSTKYLARIRPVRDGEVHVSLPANSVRSYADNVGNKRSDPGILTADLGPEVTITSASSTVAGPFAVTITFDEEDGKICWSCATDEDNFTKEDITITNGTVTHLDNSANPIFTATITPTSTGTTTLMIDEEKARDDNNNWNRESNSLSVNVNADDPTGVSLSARPSRVSEGSGPTAVTVTASVNGNAVYSQSVVVTVSVDDSNQDNVVGFKPVADFTVVIPAGQDEGKATFTIEPRDDNEHTADEKVSISGTLSIQDGGSVSSTTITLEDDDLSPEGVVLSVSPATVDEATPNTEVVVTATVVGGVTYPEDRIVDVTTAGTMGPGAVDFETIPPFVVIIDEGEEQGSTTIPINPIDDQIDEVDEVISFTGVLDNEDPVTSTELTLTDDDPAPTGITVSLSPTSVDEDAGETTVTVTATAGGSAYATDQTIAVTVAGTLADGAVDFEPVEPFEILLPAEALSAEKTFVLTPENDNNDEANETVTVTGTYGTPPETSSASLTIVDDEATPTEITLMADPATISEDDGETAIAVKATIGGSTTYGKDETINITVSASGIPGTVDFEPVSSFVLTIPAGMASAETTFNLEPENDNVDEVDETVMITGTGPTGEITTTVVITDDDEMPGGISLSVTPSEVPENATLMRVTVEATVTGSTTYALDQVLDVEVSPSGQDGVVGFQPVQDFTLTVPAGEMSASSTVEIRPIDNNVDEENEVVYISAMHDGDDIATSILITDDDNPPTSISLLASPSSVPENAGPTKVTVTARVEGGTTFARDKAVAMTVSGSGNPGVVGFADVSEFTLTIPAAKETASTTFTLTPDNNVIDEANETVTILGIVDAFTPSTSLILVDDDAPPTGITLSPDPPTVEEGAGATTVTVTASVQGGTTYAFGQAVPVNVSGTGTAGVVRFEAVPGFEIFVEPGSPTGTATFTITPEDNVIDESDETVTISGTHLSREVATTLRLIDDDEPPTGVSLAVNPESIDEGGGTVTVTVTATVEGGTTYASEQTLNVNVGASGGTNVVGFEPVSAFSMTVPAGLAVGTATFNITPVDNREREDDETVSVTTSHLGTTPSATVTIVDNDAPLARYTEVTSVILPELTRAMTASTVGAVASRISKAGMGADAMALNVGGHSTLASVLSEYRTRRTLGGLSWQERVGASSFVVSPGVAAGLAGRLTFWGQGDYTSLGGGGLGVVDWDGSLTGMHIGTDADLGSGVLIGLAVSRTGGSADYTYTGANQVAAAGSTLNGTYDASMQSVHPYASWSFLPGSYIWASAGVGAGSVEIADDESAEQTSDSRMITAVIGATMRVLASGGTSIDIKSEAWQSSVEVDDNGGNIEGSTVNVNRIRVGVETAFGRRFASGAMMTPFVELGVRNDGGDGQTGFGAEVGGGLRLSTTSGLNLEGRGRALVAHKGDLQEWGFSGTLAYSPGAGREGLSLELGSTVGSASSGLQRLWSDQMMTPRMSDTEPRIQTEIGYGMGMYKGILRPFGGAEMSETHGMRTRLGTEYRVGPRFNVGVEVQHVALPGEESRSPMVRGTVTLR